MTDIIYYFSHIGVGIVLTLKLLAGSLIIGILFGTLLAVLRYNSGIGRILINGLISVIRGTPLILQLSLIYFTAPYIIGLKLSVISAGIIAFGLNSSAYVAEIIRAGIESLPKGQFEAAKTLAIPNFYMWKDIILPQVFVNIFPALINEIIALLKETAIISIIGGMDIMRSSQVIAAERYEYFLPLCIAGLYYYGLVLIIEWIAKKVCFKKQSINQISEQ
ncbi:MAG: amino acid ABC transporter permease [Holosporales bacterium]|jgi:polar amino acid transport system permease protein|nr:amino acid ABC transporter permease [Holosporales bacterium]